MGLDDKGRHDAGRGDGGDVTVDGDFSLLPEWNGRVFLL